MRVAVTRAMLYVSCLAIAAVTTLLPPPSPAAVSDLTIGNYQLVSSTRITRTVFEYTYKTNITNAGSVDMLNVAATVTSRSSATVVTDNSLTFGTVAASQTVTSSDTFKIQQDRSVPFDPANLVWTITGQEKPDPNATDDDQDGSSENQGDCNDANAAIHPGAAERCNDVDDNCNGTKDEGFEVAAVCTVGVGACARTGTSVCATTGDGTVCNATPGTPTAEVCNNLDDDCDGQVDNGAGEARTCGVGACARTVSSCAGGQPEECVPGTPTAEVCGNSIDEDCNGSDLTCVTVLPITITDPPNLSSFNRPTVAVTGTVAPEAVEVTCNGRPAGLNASGFGATVPLKEGSNIITCVAKDAAENIGSASISVTLDSMPPRIAIDSPADGATVTASPISVTGMVNDLVMGTVNGDEAGVTCNGVQAQVANRRFVANVPLNSGPNPVACVGIDKVGNVDTARIIVTLDTTAPTKISIVSGNNQTGEIGMLLPDPLVVALTENGAPAVGKVVVFKVLQNDGTISTNTNSNRILAITTDNNGQAQVNFTLGTWAGAGNNQVEAMASGYVGEARFSASALPAGGNSIVVDSGNLQEGAVDQPLPKPFVAVVIDRGSNRLSGVPVTFRVVNGGGNFDGQPETTVTSDSDGRVAATLTLGSEEGFDNNVVEATFPGNPGFAAAFVASGKQVGDPADTKISGVVFDNSNTPLAGVTLKVDGREDLTTRSDEQGQFMLQPAPVGHVKLIADGATAQRPGAWPKLEYEMVTIAGRNNTIGMPIYLLPLDLDHGVLVDETHGGTLTLPEVPGFALTILPDSATFPDGSRRGVVSVTVVHPDKVPMVPNFGQQPRFIITIQPAGTHFNPPAALTLPNVDGLAPGQKTEMYSFDHDLGSFVSIGPATVSEDGMVVQSDPGVGVIKGGWHCGGNPATTGSSCEPTVEVYEFKNAPRQTRSYLGPTNSFVAPWEPDSFFTGGPPLEARARITIPVGCPNDGKIEWSSEGGGDNDYLSPAEAGDTDTFKTRPIPSSGYGWTDSPRVRPPLTYTVIAKVKNAFCSRTIIQDKVDQIRQMYADHGIVIPYYTRFVGTQIPLRPEFKADFEFLKSAYRVWVWQTKPGAEINFIITSSYRNPKENQKAYFTSSKTNDPKAAAQVGSVHQYGFAIDICPVPAIGGDPNTLQDDLEFLADTWNVFHMHSNKTGEGHPFKDSNGVLRCLHLASISGSGVQP